MDPETPATLTLYSPSRRVKLVPPTEPTDEAVAILRTDPITLRYLKFLPQTMTTEENRVRRETRAKDPQILDLLAYVRGEDGSYELGGTTGVFHMDNLQKCCEAGILVAPKFQGQGVTAEIFYTLFTYIFEEKGFHRIGMETAMENMPMRGWLEKVADIRQEGVKKEWWTDMAGGWTDVGSYAILDWEWRDKVKERLEKRIASRNQPVEGKIAA
ncbi:hypothetical protein MD484_g3668, partial [Candolleomyces efflorescens]